MGSPIPTEAKRQGELLSGSDKVFLTVALTLCGCPRLTDEGLTWRPAGDGFHPAGAAPWCPASWWHHGQVDLQKEVFNSEQPTSCKFTAWFTVAGFCSCEGSKGARPLSPFIRERVCLCTTPQQGTKLCSRGCSWALGLMRCSRG